MCDERNIDPLNYNNNTNRRRKRQSSDNAGVVVSKLMFILCISYGL